MPKPPHRPSRLRRRLGLTLVSVAALLGGAWYALNQYVQGDSIRQTVLQKITEATGRKAVIREPLGLTFSLNPAVKVTGFSLANADWGSEPEMVSAETVLVRVDLLRLLSREIVVQDLELEQPVVLLEVNRAGQGNWQFTPQKPERAKAGQRTDAADRAAGTQGFRLVMESVKITGGQVTWHDMAQDTRKTLVLQALTLRPDGEGMQADLAGRYQDVPYTLDLSLAALQPLLRQDGDVPFELKGSFADSTLTASGLVELVASQRGGLPVRRLKTELRAELPTLAALKPFRAADAKPLPELGPVRLRLAVEGTPDRLNLSPVQVQALDSELAGTFTLTPPLDGRALALEGTAQLKAASLAKLGALAQQQLADVPLTLTTGLRLARETVRLEGLKLTAGESSLAGDVRVTLPKDGKTLPEDLRVTVEAPLLRLADFTAAAADGGSAAGKSSGKDSGKEGDRSGNGAVFSREPLPLDGLKGLNADVKATVGQLVLPPRGEAPARTFRDVRLRLEADGRTVRVSELGAGLPGTGQLTASAQLTPGGTPTLRYQVATTGVTLGTFLREWGVTGDVTGGPARLRSEGQTAGVSLHDWAANLTGVTEVVVQKAQVQGGVTDVLGGPLVQALLPGLAQGADKAVQVNCVVSRWPTRGGVMTTDLTLVDTGQLTVAGTGAVNLGEEQIRMTLLPKAKQQSLSGVVAPLSVRGPLNKPSFRIDEKAVAGDVLQGVLSGRITTGKPLEVLQQVFGPRGGAGTTAAAADPCAQVLTDSGEIRAPGSAPAPAAEGTPTDQTAPQGEQPQQQGILPQELEQRLDKILPGVGGLFGR